MILLSRLKILLSGVKGNEITGDNLDTDANEIIVEINEVIIEFKKLNKHWTWKFWSAYKIYQPLVQQIVQLVKEVGDTFNLSNEQKKELAKMVCWKVIEPLLPTYAKLPIIKTIIQKGIDTAIEKIYGWIFKGKQLDGQTFVVGSVR
jgi:hypothetical protein